MLQTATAMSQSAPATSMALGTGARNRPAPAAQDAKQSDAETVENFATELSSADVSQAQLAQADASLLAGPVTTEELSLPVMTENLIAEKTETPQQADTGADTIAEEWILNMLGQQNVQLQARDLSDTQNDVLVSDANNALANDLQILELPVVASLATQAVLSEKIAESKPSQEQQPLSVLNQSPSQKQTQQQPALVINNTEASNTQNSNTENSNDEATANNTKTANVAENKTQASSLVPPPVTERAPEQRSDQTKSTVAALMTDRLNGVSPAQAHDGATSSISGATNQTISDAVPERTLKLHGTEAKWGEQMLHALRENVGLQVQHRQQSATIRLDPPELGAMEIFLSHESGRLTVHISASQSDVARMLQQTSDRLRQELVNQNFVQVNVQVSSDNQGGQRHSQQRSAQASEEQITQNHQGTESTVQAKTTAHNDILVTV